MISRARKKPYSSAGCRIKQTTLTCIYFAAVWTFTHTRIDQVSAVFAVNSIGAVCFLSTFGQHGFFSLKPIILYEFSTRSAVQRFNTNYKMLIARKYHRTQFRKGIYYVKTILRRVQFPPEETLQSRW